MAKEIVEDLTNLVERFEILEEKLDINISAIYASFKVFSDGTPWVFVNFDVASRNGGVIDSDVRLRINCYNLDGQLVKTDDGLILASQFMGFDTKKFLIKLDSTNEKPHKIRIFPVAG